MRAKLRPLLEKTTVSDEQLLEKINQIMSAETERYNKMSSGGKKGLRVNQVGTSSVSSNPAPGQPGQTPQSERNSEYLSFQDSCWQASDL